AAVALAVHRGARTAEFDLDHDVVGPARNRVEHPAHVPLLCRHLHPVGEHGLLPHFEMTVDEDLTAVGAALGPGQGASDAAALEGDHARWDVGLVLVEHLYGVQSALALPKGAHHDPRCVVCTELLPSITDS